MTIPEFIASIEGRADALEQIDGALWGDDIDPRLTPEEVAALKLARLELVKAESRK